MSLLAIIILNYNSWQDTLKEVELCHSTFCIPYNDIIVIDNASKNEAHEKLSEASADKFKYIQNKVNSGYAAGNNIGLRYAKESGYKYAWVLNNDIEFPDENLVQRILDVFTKDNRIAAVNSDVFAPDGHMFNRDVKRPSFFDFTFGVYAYRKKGREIEDKGNYGYIYRPQGCSMFLDLKKMDEINYFDENTFLYWEENILAERLLNKGYKCACCTLTRVIHNHSKTVKSSFDKKKIMKINNKSFSYYLREYRNFPCIAVKLAVLFNTLKLIIID